MTICRHWWVIETPHDGQRMLAGACKLCGVARLFPCTVEETPVSRQHPKRALARETAYFGASIRFERTPQ